MLLMYSVLHCILLGIKLLLLLIMLVELLSPGAHLTKDNSVEFRIQLNLSSIEFEEDWSNHKNILHIPRQHSCLRMCKISLWLDWGWRRYKQMYFNQIWNLIKISSVGHAPDLKMFVAIRMKIFTTNYPQWVGLVADITAIYSALLIYRCQFSWKNSWKTPVSHPWRWGIALWGVIRPWVWPKFDHCKCCDVHITCHIWPQHIKSLQYRWVYT